MRKGHRFLSACTVLLALFLVAPAQGANLNKSIKIAAGEESEGASTINGSIRVGDGAVVTGTVSTVNGTIRIGENARVKDAETVNGGVRLAEGVSSNDLGSVNGSVTVGSDATVSGEVSVVNGSIRLDTGTSVSGNVSNVNGEIGLYGARVGGDLSTVSGDVLLQEKAILIGNLIVEKPSNWSFRNNRRKPKVIVGPDSRIEGNIVLEREVELFISDKAKVGGVTGVMALSDAVRFSGDKP